MTVLVATDFSEPSAMALRLGAREARQRVQTLAVTHCLESSTSGLGHTAAFDVEQAAPEKLRREARQKLRDFVDSHLPAEERPRDIAWFVQFDAPAEGICALAEREQVDLLAVGASGRGRLQSVILGSTAEEVVRASTRPVLTVPDDADLRPVEQILVPVDLSECSRRALAIASAWARRTDAALAVLHEGVVPTSRIGRPDLGPSEQVRESFRTRLAGRFEEWCDEADLQDLSVDKLLNVHSYETRDPAEAILEAAEDRGADLVVMGTHGRRGFARFLLGSTTLKVLHSLPTPLLTVCGSAET